jgi:rhodanese-related sulfurtransferase
MGKKIVLGQQQENKKTNMDQNLDMAIYSLAYENGVIVDVRTEQEYCSGHLCQAIHIPTPRPPLTDWDQSILAGRLHKALNGLPENAPIIVYCKKGIRAAITKDILQTQGFKKVLSLGGVETEPLLSVMTGQRQCPFLKVCNCALTTSNNK